MCRVQLLTSGNVITTEFLTTEFKACWVRIQWEWLSYNNGYKLIGGT